VPRLRAVDALTVGEPLTWNAAQPSARSRWPDECFLNFLRETEQSDRHQTVLTGGWRLGADDLLATQKRSGTAGLSVVLRRVSRGRSWAALVERQCRSFQRKGIAAGSKHCDGTTINVRLYIYITNPWAPVCRHCRTNGTPLALLLSDGHGSMRRRAVRQTRLEKIRKIRQESRPFIRWFCMRKIGRLRNSPQDYREMSQAPLHSFAFGS
jgi:hypothetical protein